MQKYVDRTKQSADKIFDARTLQHDYKTVVTLIKPGMTVLDVGCGTGAITKGIAELVGPTGKVVGIDHTLEFINSGNQMNSDIENLELIHIDLMDFTPNEKFDLIVSARTLQWLTKQKEAIIKMKSLLKSNGGLSVLDYIHEDISWEPKVPDSMQGFYQSWLNWRRDSGMNNRMADDLPDLFREAGFQNIEIYEANEYYPNNHPLFVDKLKIWLKVASSKQLVEEGYVSEDLRQSAMNDYQNWIHEEALSMEMVLKEVRGISL